VKNVSMKTLPASPREIKQEISRILPFDLKWKKRADDGEEWLEAILAAELPTLQHGTSILQIRRFARFATGAGFFMVERHKAGECHFSYQEIAQGIKPRLGEGERPISTRIVRRVVACLLGAGFLMRVSRDKRLCGNRPGQPMARGSAIAICMPRNNLARKPDTPGTSDRYEAQATGTDGLAGSSSVTPQEIPVTPGAISGHSATALITKTKNPDQEQIQEGRSGAKSKGDLSIQALPPWGIFDQIEESQAKPLLGERPNPLTDLLSVWNRAAQELNIGGVKAPRVEKVTDHLRGRMRECWREAKAEGLDPIEALSGAITGFWLDGWGITQGQGLAQAMVPIASGRTRTWLYFYRVATGEMKGSRKASMGPAQRNIEKLRRWMDGHRTDDPFSNQIAEEEGERLQLEAVQKEREESSKRWEDERRKALAEREKGQAELAARCETEGHEGTWHRLDEASDKRTCQRCGETELRPYERKNWPSVKPREPSRSLKLKPMKHRHRYGPVKKNPYFTGRMQTCDCGRENYVE